MATVRYVVVPLGVDTLDEETADTLSDAATPLVVTVGEQPDSEASEGLVATCVSDHDKASRAQSTIYDAATAAGLNPSRGAIYNADGYADLSDPDA